MAGHVWLGCGAGAAAWPADPAGAGPTGLDLGNPRDETWNQAEWAWAPQGINDHVGLAGLGPCMQPSGRYSLLARTKTIGCGLSYALARGRQATQ